MSSQKMNYKFWYCLIILLSLPPLISTGYGIFKDKNLNSISINISIPESFNVESCLNKKDKKTCLEISKSIEHTKDEMKRMQNELENNISNSLRAYDKNIDVLSFSLSLYAILITVISLFFSFRESQRIDEGLKKMDDSLVDITSKMDDSLVDITSKLENKLNEANDRISQLDININARLLEISGNHINNTPQTETISSFEPVGPSYDELNHANESQNLSNSRQPEI